MKRHRLTEDKDPMGRAIYEYFTTGKAGKLRVFSSQFDEDELPVKDLFRTLEQMPLLEQKALQLAYGRILDVGAGSGCHSLVLQEMGKESLAIDISPWAVEVMKKRGIDAYLTKNRSEKDQKSPKAHTKTDTSSQEKLFGEIQNSFLSNLCNLW